MFKPTKRNLVKSILLGFAFLSTPSQAHCDIHFNYGVTLDPKHIRIQEKGITYVQISQTGQLFVRGREIPLNDKQQDLVNRYALGIRTQVPELVDIAIEGVDVGLKAVNKVIAGLTGENSAAHQKLQKQFEELHWRIRKRFNHSDDSYYIAPQDLDDFDEIFAGEFEQEIEEIVTDSIGTILGAVGDAVANQSVEDENNEQRAGNVGERVESMSDDLAKEINTKTSTLESKANAFCNKLVELDIIESEIQSQISILSDFNLFGSKH